MISLPTYNVAIGRKARTSRRLIEARVSGLLVAQISRRNGLMLRIAAKRWRRLSWAAGRGGGILGLCGKRAWKAFHAEVATSTCVAVAACPGAGWMYKDAPP